MAQKSSTKKLLFASASAQHQTAEPEQDNCRRLGGRLDVDVVDMGAYEFLPADLDGTSSVALGDFSTLALHWGETNCGRCAGADLTCDGNVDWNDMQDLADRWLEGI